MDRKIVKLSPRDNSILYEMTCDNSDRINLIIDEASIAFKKWSTYPVDKRIEVICQFMLAVENNKDSIIQAIIDETCKPYIEAETEIIESLDICKYFVDQKYEYFSYTDSFCDASWKGKVLETIRQPLGVVAIIKPWNYPFELCVWSIIPTLIAGNAIVLKPSEYSSKVGEILVNLFKETNAPENTVSIVIGDSKTGELLLEESRIAGVSFTGSSKTGLSIASKLSTRLIPLNLELGGKDYAIVFDDADIDMTVKGLLWGSFTNAGQVCTSIENILVHKDVYDEFMSKFIKGTQELKLDIDVGPVITKEKLIDLLGLIHSSEEDGLCVKCGGIGSSDLQHKNGNYLLPTIITADNEIAHIDDVELFAPIVVVRKFSNDEDIIKACNSSNFGLGCSIWTRNIERSRNLLEVLDVGMLWVNEVNLPMPSIPWVGSRKSAFGFSLSKSSVYTMTKVKSLHIDNSAEARTWWYPYN